MTLPRSLTLLSTLTLMTVSGISHAAPATVDGAAISDARSADGGWGVGATVSLNERPFIGVDDQQESLPYFSGRYGRFSIEGLDMRLDLFNTDRQGLGLVATPRFYEVKESFADKGELNGISTTRDTWFAGLGYHLDASLFNINAQALFDVGGESDGTELTLSVSRPFGDDTLQLIPALGLTWQDASLVEHFYGVSADEARPGRPQYGDQASLNRHVSLTGLWRPHQNWRLLAVIKGEQLGDGITDSPIIEEDRIGSVLFGAVYQF